VTSRNRYHYQAFAEVKELLGEKPLVLDREFSYLELMQALVREEVNFVIRLKVGAHFFDQEGKQVALSVKKGETRILNKVFYMGKVFVNVIGQWQAGLKEPMWIMTNLPAEQGFSFYEQRMKIEETFKDLKSLLAWISSCARSVIGWSRWFVWRSLPLPLAWCWAKPCVLKSFLKPAGNASCILDCLSCSNSN
jgi:hypothetical protein